MGYLGYVVLQWLDIEVSGWLVPTVFFFGACFVLLVTTLSLRTVRDLGRIAALERETVTDALTGIANRRYLDRRLDEETYRARRYRLPLAVLMLDIDHFKSINDDRGDKAGDLLLIQLAGLLREAVRSSDIVARYGGDELMIVSPCTEPEQARALARRIQRTVEQRDFEIPSDGPGPSTLRCAVSIGVANLEEDMLDVQSLVDAADTALYRAKSCGRNRVEMFRAERVEPRVACSR